MRRLVSCVFVAVVGLASAASAQSIVDLSQPQKGKSRFVLNADMTPADLGAASEPDKPVAVGPRVPACGEGCKLEQPVIRRDRAYRDEPGSSGSRSGTGPRVVVISNANGNQTQQAAKPAPAQRSGFRLRRR